MLVIFPSPSSLVLDLIHQQMGTGKFPGQYSVMIHFLTGVYFCFAVGVSTKQERE
jgi:hypothetical protein